MAKVIATGLYYGNRITVESVIEDGILKIYVNEMDIPDIQNTFYELVKTQPAMGGTYYPDENSLLAAFNVLQHTFFDLLEEIHIEGNIGTIPFKQDKIY